MISTSSAYAAANAKLQKKPIFVLVIDGYSRAFSNADLDGSIYAGSGISVPETTGPWDFGSGINAAYEYDNGVAGSGSPPPYVPHDFTAPIVIPRFFLAGEVATVVVSAYSNQYRGNPNPTGSSFPLQYLAGFGDGSAYAGHLMGCWCDSFGRVVEIFHIADVTHGGGAAGNTYLLTCPSGASRLQFGVNDDRYDDNTLAWTISVNAVRAGIIPWLVGLDDLKLTVSDLDGGFDLGNLVFTVQDHLQLITSDLASFVFEGKQCRLLQGYVGMDLTDFVTLYTGTVDRVESENGNTEYKFTVSDQNLKRLSQVIYTTGDDGFATDSKHPKTINAHPLDILVNDLEQVGIPLVLIDTAKIYFYRDTIFNGLSYEFTLTSAPVAKDFIESELMKPLGMYLWQNNLGLVSINSFYPMLSGDGSYTPPTPPVMTLDNDVVVDVPLEQEAELIDQVTIRFDWDETGEQKFLAESVQNWNPGILKYGLYGSQIIESKGMKSGFQGFFMAMLVARLLFLRYGNKQLVLDPLSLLWNASILEPGDIIALSNPFLPDRKAGALGVTDMTFEVLDRTYRFMEGLVDVKVLRLDISQFKQYLITPNGQPTFAADTALNQAKYMYQSDATGKYSTGAAGNTLG